mgnify:CR=1 FL=1
MGIRAKVHYLKAKENWGLIWRDVQANQLQLLNVDVEDERHARVQGSMVASTIREKQAR